MAEGDNNTRETTSLLGLFEAPPPPVTGPVPAPLREEDDSSSLNFSREDPQDENLRDTIVRSNHSNSSVNSSHNDTPLQETRPRALILDESIDRLLTENESSPTRKESLNEKTPLLLPTFTRQQRRLGNNEITPKTRTHKRTSDVAARPHLSRPSQLPSIREINNGNQNTKWLASAARTVCVEISKPTTWIGTFMFMLFQVVFSLTMGAAIIRPYGTKSILGIMTKMAALGILFGSWPWLGLSREIPAIYPTVDLFSAPFLANIAALIDEDLLSDRENMTDEENDSIFLASFAFLAVTSLVVSGTLLVGASVFRLANLGAFLPFPVLCGFFSAVGVMMWSLAFKVDNNGRGISTVLFSGDWNTMQNGLLHHVPSAIVAAIMRYLGPKNPFYVAAVVFGTIGVFHITMLVLGVSMEEMIQAEWFWSSEDLVYEKQTPIGFAVWQPPAPFGWLKSLVSGKVRWSAVWKGIDTTLALSFLYLIRCSLHGAAMKKNVPNLERVVNTDTTDSMSTDGTRAPRHSRTFSEVVDIEHVLAGALSREGPDMPETTKERAKPPHVSLKDILMHYGISQYFCALAGGFAVTPSVAVAPTMYVLRAEHVAPQIGSVLALLYFYMTDFELVQYIPKTAFSSLLVLAFYDMMATWFIKSYFKTKEKIEWLVVPLIVIFANMIGLLQAVFLGLAMSTVLFVAMFFRSGVVKFISHGVNVRSTIERPLNDARWLDQHGDLIQILVLQNYLFFGNASSIESYISSMFEDPMEDVDPIFLPPLPKILVLDLTLVTGIDTSAVDAFSEILALCSRYNCKLFLAGVSQNLRQVMYLGGVKPEIIQDRTKRKLRFFSDLDAAVGKAEDILLEGHRLENSFSCQASVGESGFECALRSIDEQHDTTSLKDLGDLQEHIETIELKPGEILYEDQEFDRGIFFIEEGILKIERDSCLTVSRLGSGAFSRLTENDGTLNELSARSGSIGKATLELKAEDAQSFRKNFRIARVGPGWVIGSLEALAGVVNPTTTVAVTYCRLHCLSFRKIEEIEESNSLLVLKLYKLLANLMAKRQEITIGQLSTLHAIIGAPAQKKPPKRSNKGSSLWHVPSSSSLG